MPIKTYEHCSCPQCKCSLNGVSVTTEICPVCRRPLESRAVWSTRKYPGLLVLPGWLRAFGWPFALILVGTSIMAVTYYYKLGRNWVEGAAIATTGGIFFMLKLANKGDAS